MALCRIRPHRKELTSAPNAARNKHIKPAALVPHPVSRSAPCSRGRMQHKHGCQERACLQPASALPARGFAFEACGQNLVSSGPFHSSSARSRLLRQPALFVSAALRCAVLCCGMPCARRPRTLAFSRRCEQDVALRAAHADFCTAALSSALRLQEDIGL
jgi:hypothetical protein